MGSAAPVEEGDIAEGVEPAGWAEPVERWVQDLQVCFGATRIS